MALHNSSTELLGTAGTLLANMARDSFWCRSSLFEGTEETGHYSPFLLTVQGSTCKNHVFFLCLCLYMFLYFIYVNVRVSDSRRMQPWDKVIAFE